MFVSLRQSRRGFPGPEMCGCTASGTTSVPTTAVPFIYHMCIYTYYLNLFNLVIFVVFYSILVFFSPGPCSSNALVRWAIEESIICRCMTNWKWMNMIEKWSVSSQLRVNRDDFIETQTFRSMAAPCSHRCSRHGHGLMWSPRISKRWKVRWSFEKSSVHLEYVATHYIFRRTHLLS